MLKRSAIVATFVLTLIGSSAFAYAAGEVARPFPDRAVPAELAKKRIVGRKPLIVGDLKPASASEADVLMNRASDDLRMLDKCVEIGGDLIQRSGHTLELAAPWGFAASTQILTAYCNDGIVFLGGSRQEVEDGTSQTWLFYWNRKPGQEFGPVSMMPRKVYGPGNWRGRTPYTLTELRAIDPISRQLLFAGTTADGREELLAAKFAILPLR